MDPTLKEALDELRAQNRDMALAQAAQGEQLAILIEQGAEIIKLLTPVKGDVPTLEEGVVQNPAFLGYTGRAETAGL